jgi:hypothetical protein
MEILQEVDESEPKISDFISGKAYWRIDCLGSLSYADKPDLESQPTISIAVSEATEKPTSRNCWRTNFTLTKDQRTETVPIAILPILKAGDFWSGKQLAVSPICYENANSAIDSSQIKNAVTVRLGDVAPWSKQSEKPEFLLSYFHHPYHKLFTRAYAELIDLDDSSLLIIPHWEIIRFYFGSSTQLIESIFNVNHTFDNLFDATRSTKSDIGHAHIHLRAQIPYVSATDVGRIRFCPKARQSINVLRNSLIAQSANRQPVFPKTMLPISGPTTLKMKGRWMTYKNGKRGFICYEIMSCAAAFPFSSFSYFKDMPGDTNPEKDRSHLEPMSVRSRPQTNEGKTPKDKTIQQKDANTIFGTSTYQIETPSRFPFLDNVQQEKQRIDPYTHYSEPAYQPDPEDELGEGVGSGGRDALQSTKLQKKEHEINTSTELSVNFEHFFSAINLLLENKKINSCEYICPSPDRNDARCTLLPLVITQQGRISKLSFIDYIKGYVHSATLRRRAIVAKIHYNKGVVYLIEAEARVFKGKQLDNFPTLLLKTLSSDEITEREIKDVLQAFSHNELLWKIPLHLAHIYDTPIRHPQKKSDDTTRTYIDRLYQKFLTEIIDN